MRLLALEAENVKRLRAIALRFEGSMTVIEGRNGQGKTSAIDSIWYALGGAGALPPEVLRRGTEKGRSHLNFGDFTVERTFKPKGTTLEVRMRDGKKVASPQTFLDALCGPDGLAFDPLAFFAGDRAKQLDVVKRLAGVDLTALEQRKLTATDARTVVAREGKEVRARVQAFASDPADLPAKPVDVAELLAQRQQLEAQRDAGQKASTAAHYANLEETNRVREVTDARQAVADARARLEAAEHRLEEVTATHARAKEAARVAGELLAAAAVPDFAGVDAALRSAEATNAAIRRRDERKQLEQQLEAKLKEHAKLEKEIDECDVERRRVLREAKFPIDGLGFTLDGVTFRDVPLEQASQAEQLRVAMAIALALNPRLKLVLIRSGSLVDSEGLQLIAELATKAEAQVIVERVADKPGAGFFIEDGALLEAEVTA